MSYTYLRDQGEVSSVDFFSDIGRFAPLNLKKMLETNLSSDSKKDCYPGFQSGTMSAHLMQGHGKESRMSFAVDSPVKTLARQEGEAVSQREREAVYGVKWQESLAKYNLNSCSWKIAQQSLLEGLDEFSGTWPNWGIMQDGECWEAIPLVQITGEPASGWLPTPLKSEGIGWSRSSARNPRESIIKVIRGGHQFHWIYIPLWNQSTIMQAADLADWMMGWPLGWSGSQGLETDKFQAWLHLHSKFFQDD
jgi:hypothetical protein